MKRCCRGPPARETCHDGETGGAPCDRQRPTRSRTWPDRPQEDPPRRCLAYPRPGDV